MKEYWYVVNVNPIPWSSPEVAIGRKGGKVYPMVFSVEELKNYKQAVADDIEKKYPDAPLIEDEIALEFYFVRNLGVDSSNKRRRTHIADATNMQKATEDALQGVLFVNDSQVVHVESTVLDQSEDAVGAVAIRLIWHPTLPIVPEKIREEMAQRMDVLSHAEKNIHDVNIEELF